MFKQIKSVNNTHRVRICEVFNKVASAVPSDAVHREFIVEFFTFRMSYGFSAHAKCSSLTLIRKLLSSSCRFSRNSHSLKIPLRSSASNLTQFGEEIWEIRERCKGNVTRWSDFWETGWTAFCKSLYWIYENPTRCFVTDARSQTGTSSSNWETPTKVSLLYTSEHGRP